MVFLLSSFFSLLTRHGDAALSRLVFVGVVAARRESRGGRRRPSVLPLGPDERPERLQLDRHRQQLVVRLAGAVHVVVVRTLRPVLAHLEGAGPGCSRCARPLDIWTVWLQVLGYLGLFRCFCTVVCGCVILPLGVLMGKAAGVQLNGPQGQSW